MVVFYHPQNKLYIVCPTIAIDLSDLKQKKSSLRKSGSAQKSSLHSSPSLSSMDSDYTGGSSASYTGGSDTTGSTGDSGFGGDTNPFLKVSIGGRHNPKKPTGKLYYKRLGTPDDVDCYTNVAKGDPQGGLGPDYSCACLSYQ